MKDNLTKTLKFIAVLAACYLVFLGCGFFAVKYGITNTRGAVDANNERFRKNALTIEKVALASEKNIEVVATSNAEALSDSIATDLGNNELGKKIEDLKLIKKRKDENFCKLDEIGAISGVNAQRILSTYQKTESDGLISKMILAVSLRLTDNVDYQKKITLCENTLEEKGFSPEVLGLGSSKNNNQNIFSWVNEEEWKSIESGILKDKDIINQVATQVGIAPRLIVSSLIVEQLRLFHSQRELFKKFFEPLKILGNSTKISLGVMGVKEATAIDTENHLKDPSSPYYLGVDREHLLDLSSANPTQERFLRLTDDKNHYYAYLYGAVYLKEMMMQWERAGYSIKYRPEIVGTLFNVGFPQSKPNADPKVGGSRITIGDGEYSFGSLSYEFYYSGEMVDEFPYITTD